VTEAPWPEEEASDGDDAPDPARARVEEGRALTRSGDHAKAIAAFDAAIVIDDKLPSAWAGRCYAKLLAGDHAAARVDCEKALGLDSKPAYQAAVWFNLGMIGEATGKRDAAIEAYKKSQALRDTKQARAALAALAAKK
jgi:tetratricopeptide (TPR) repeat protein